MEQEAAHSGDGEDMASAKLLPLLLVCPVAAVRTAEGPRGSWPWGSVNPRSDRWDSERELTARPT